MKLNKKVILRRLDYHYLFGLFFTLGYILICSLRANHWVAALCLLAGILGCEPLKKNKRILKAITKKDKVPIWLSIVTVLIVAAIFLAIGLYLEDCGNLSCIAHTIYIIILFNI